ncbi:tRNA splicing endonuclease subunit sen2, partial [Nowakowskiella sp. JEL0078]
MEIEKIQTQTGRKRVRGDESKYKKLPISKELSISQTPTTVFEMLHTLLFKLIPQNLLTWPSLTSTTRKISNYEATLLEGTNVVWVTNQNHIEALWTGGFFGKGTLSRSEPTWKKRRMLANELSEVYKSDINVKSRKDILQSLDGLSRRERDHIEVMAKYIAEHNKAQFTDSETEVSECDEDFEKLQLDPFETFFLSFALGCLDVKNENGNLLSKDDLWKTFRQFSRLHRFKPPNLTVDTPIPNVLNSPYNSFIANYIAYHYYRTQGWIVKSGLKYGAEFGKNSKSRQVPFIFSSV